MSVVEFHDASHTYRVDGHVTPSVTQILRVIDDLSKIPAEYLERARVLGTAVHRATELFDLHDLDEASLDPMIVPYLEAWKRFRLETGFVVEAVESRLHHAVYGYCGTLDRRGVLHGKRVVIDIKSGELYPSHGPQTAAYQKADEHMTGAPIEARYVVQLTDTGRYSLQPMKDATDWSTFLAALTIHRFKARSQ